MLELHAFVTPNSLKPVIALEELGLDYTLVPVDLRKGQQRGDDFVQMNPNAKVPVLVDRSSSLILSESAAILMHLAEKSGTLMARSGPTRAKVLEQLFFHASGVSPAFLQAFLVSIQKEPQADARGKALKEVDRVLEVMDRALIRFAYTAGDTYSIADIAHFGWLWRHKAIGVDLAKYSEVSRWYETVADRPAVVRALAKIAILAS